MELTSRERVLRTLQLMETDRIPCSPFVFDAWFGLAPKDYADRLVANTDIMVAVRTGSKAETCVGGELHNVSKRFSTPDGNIREVIQTPKGDLTAAIKPTGDHIDWYLEHLFKDPSDVEKFLSIPYKPLDPPMENFYKWESYIGTEGLVLGEISNPFYCPAYYFGTEENLIQTYSNKDLVTSLLDALVVRACDVIKNASKLGVKVWRIIGAEYASPRVLPPHFYKDIIVKYDKQLVDTIHECGGIAYMHMHDKMMDVLDDIIEIGPDALDPLEAPPLGDVNLSAVKKRLGDKMCLVGNIDDMNVLSRASKEEVERLSLECIEAAGKGGGYILGGTASGLFMPKTVDNFIVMADVCKRVKQ